MLTALFLLSLQSAPPQPRPIETGALTIDAPTWAFIPLRTWTDQPSTGVAALMYSVGIDAAVPPESEERADLAIYLEDEL